MRMPIVVIVRMIMIVRVFVIMRVVVGMIVPVIMVVVVIVMMVMVIVQHDLAANAAHALFDDVVDHDFKGIHIQRLQFFIEFLNRNAQPNQRAENHIPARPANAFKM